MDNTSFAPGNNSINNSVPPSPAPQYSEPEHKHFLNKKFIITFVVLLLLGASAYAGIWYWGNQQQSGIYTFEECVKAKDSKILETYPEQCVTNDGQTFPNPDQTAQEPPVSGNVPADWKTYTNTQYGFEMKYPSDWEIEDYYGEEVLNSPETIKSNELSLKACKSSNSNPGRDCPSGYDMRASSTEDLGVPSGTKQISLGANNFYVSSDSQPTYYIKGSGIMIKIDAPTNDMVKIDQILSTFKFTNTNPKQTMCTQEAKQCPDGSYVSRTGPNCAFAACPK